MANDAIGTLDRILSPADSSQEFSPDVPPEFADEALALRFSDRFTMVLRYVAAWGKWMQWDGIRWAPDSTLSTFDKCRLICRVASGRCSKDSVATKLASASTVTAVERLAKADRRHAATVCQWDADPWLLNTPGGTVDLRTGEIRSHAHTDYMTKATAVTPGGECPRWLAVLDRVTGGDKDLQAYLKRMAGYCLTGNIREHALFFAYGTGANGKGVVINTLTGILGDYAVVAAIETFTASQSDQHPTNLAMLRGARLVTAQETEEGRRWAESRIKSMTGGDPITARFMRQDFFTFIPGFKLLIAGNHRPGLRNVDEAIRRRFNLVPFSVCIPLAARDSELSEKLQTEWSGIIQWAIEGCLEWQQIGLSPPQAVIDATTEYLQAEDTIALWLADCCDHDLQAVSPASVLYASFKCWAEAAGEPPWSQRRFSQAMHARGFEPTRVHGGRSGLRGLKIRFSKVREKGSD